MGALVCIFIGDAIIYGVIAWYVFDIICANVLTYRQMLQFAFKFT